MSQIHLETDAHKEKGDTVSPLPTNLQVVNFQRCKLSKIQTCVPVPVGQLLYCMTVLLKVLYFKIKNVFIIFWVCFPRMYCLYEKYYKLITVQKYIANCVSWVPGLTYKQIGLTNALSGQNLCICRGLTVKVKVTQSCPTLCDPIDYSPWNSPGQNTRVGSLSLLQGIFPTQGSDPGLLPCRWILYQLSHKGSPRRLEWVVFPFSSRSSQPSN